MIALRDYSWYTEVTYSVRTNQIGFEPTSCVWKMSIVCTYIIFIPLFGYYESVVWNEILEWNIGIECWNSLDYYKMPHLVWDR